MVVGLLLWLVSTADAENSRLVGGLRKTARERERGGEREMNTRVTRYNNYQIKLIKPAKVILIILVTQ